MTRARAPSVLLTGFGPFPGVTENASATLVRRLARTARHTFPSCRVVSRVLPTEWQAAPAMLERLYERENPALALHFGVSANAHGLVLERRALNVQSVTADAAGLLPKSQKVVEHGPSVLKTQLPVQRIAKALESCAIPASLSDNAGTYLCNAVFFRSLLLAQTVRPACRSGFIHIPADLPASDLSMERTLAGALHIVRITLEID